MYTRLVRIGTILLSQVSHSSLQINFSKDCVIVERMRLATVTVQVHQWIVATWVSYDLWINGKFSHCRVDVFTTIKAWEGWKISFLSFTWSSMGVTCNRMMMRIKRRHR